MDVYWKICNICCILENLLCKILNSTKDAIFCIISNIDALIKYNITSEFEVSRLKSVEVDLNQLRKIHTQKIQKNSTNSLPATKKSYVIAVNQ